MSKKKGKSGRRRRAAKVIPLSKTDTRTDAEMHKDAKRRQDEIDKREDEQNKRLVKGALQRMFGPPGEETRTHWADGSAKTPEELKLKFVKPPTPEERAKIKLANKIAKVLIAKKLPIERLKEILADIEADHDNTTNARLARMERRLRRRY